MKLRTRVVLCGLISTAAWAGDLVITSFPGNGTLTWTNSVSNATYRVEWAGSVTGPWQSFDALTKLTSISATSSVVTVQVPMFYRVVWTDAPEPAGEYLYQGYDSFGALVVTGRLSLATLTNSIIGVWSFISASDPPRTSHITGSGPVQFAGLSGYDLLVDLSPGADDYFYLRGKLTGNTYSGEWEWDGFASFETGTLVAEKQPPNAGASQPAPEAGVSAVAPSVR